MSDQQVRMIVLSTDNLEESITFYTETLGFPLKFRDGDHYAALDGGAVTLALATALDHPIPGQVVVGVKTDDVDAAAKAIEDNGGGIVKGPYDDAHERRAVVYDNKGNGFVFYKPLPPLTAMADLTEHTDVDLPAQQVWDVIGDFAAISKWAPRIQGQTTEDTPDGRVRSLPMAPEHVVRELEIVSSQFSYTYGMLDKPPAYEYRSTIAVIPLDAGRSRILLVHHVVDPDADDSALAERYTRFLRGNLKAMRIALGLAAG